MAAPLSCLSVPKVDWSVPDAPHAFKKFKSLCTLMFDGSIQDLNEETKVKYLQIRSGEEGIELVSTWQLTADEVKKLDTYWQRFESISLP